MQLPLFKTCRVCNQTKLTLQFFADSKSSDGKRSMCKSCDKERKQEWISNNKDKVSKYHNDYWHKNKDKLTEQRHEWAINNPDKVSASLKRLNKTLRRATSNRWAKNHPEYMRAAVKKRRAKVRGAGGTFTHEQWIEILEQHNNKCYYCGSEKDITQDHWTPLCRGGEHTASNIVPACRSCNSSKNKLTGDEYLKKISRSH